MPEVQDKVQKTWTREDVIDLLDASPKAVAKAIIQLYARQTADEQVTKDTKERNGRGFNSNDAPFLSDIAVKLPRYNNHMTPRQLAAARKMLRKYARQLLEIIEENGGVVDFGKARKSESAKSSEDDETPMLPLSPSSQSPTSIDGLF